jgi:maleamate amidohydrolase
MGLRDRPALLCIDNYNAVFGDKREPVIDSMRRFPSSCGEQAWDTVEPTQKLMKTARAKGIPIIHTTRNEQNEAFGISMSSTKRLNKSENSAWNYAFFDPLAPEGNELIIYKLKASAFFETPLASYLVKMDVNTLILCGNSTSGCVRATCLDAYMRGYSVAVAEDCVFDRNRLSHKVNLFDMNSKYADVMFLDEIMEYLDSLK